MSKAIILYMPATVDYMYKITIDHEDLDCLDSVINALKHYGIQFTIQSWESPCRTTLSSSTDTDTS